MTTEQFKVVEVAAKATGLRVEARITGTQRVEAIISGRAYANQQQALSKLAHQWVKKFK